MASVTVTITQNADGTMTGSSASSAGVSYTSASLRAIMDWAKGLVEVTLGSLPYPGTTS
jgi:hypothetical protein